MEEKRQADFLASYLSQTTSAAGANFVATSIHGDREQSQREEALRYELWEAILGFVLTIFHSWRQSAKSNRRSSRDNS